MSNKRNWWRNTLSLRVLLICFLIASPQWAVSAQSSAQVQDEEIETLIQKSQVSIDELQKVVGHVDGFQKKIEQLQVHLQNLAKKQALYRQQLERSRQATTTGPVGSESSLLSREQIVDTGPVSREPAKTQLSFERIVTIAILLLLIVVVGLLFRLTVSMRKAPIPRPVGAARGGSEQATVVPQVRERQYDPIIRQTDDVTADKTVAMAKEESREKPEEAPEPVTDVTNMDFELDIDKDESTTDDDATPYPPLQALPDDTTQQPEPEKAQLEEAPVDTGNEQIVSEISDKFKTLSDDEVAAKIALVNSYLQVKDLENAKRLIVEIFKEGDVERQQKAVEIAELIDAQADKISELTITEALKVLDSTQPLRENDRVTEISDRFRMLTDDEVSQQYILAQLQYEMGEFKQSRDSISRVLGQSGDKYKSEAIDLLFKVEAEDLEEEKDAGQAAEETGSSQDEEETPWDFTSVRPVGTPKHDQPVSSTKTDAETTESTKPQEGEPAKLNLGLPGDDEEETTTSDSLEPDTDTSAETIEETKSESAGSVFDLQFETAEAVESDASESVTELPAETAEETTADSSGSVFDLQFEAADESKGNTIEFDTAGSTETSEPAETVEEVKSSSVVDQNVVREISEKFRSLSENEHGAKLALAYVYMDMKEFDLAKEFLTEVIAFGEAQYKEEAQRLLDKIESDQAG